MKSIKPKGLIFISDVEKALEHEWFVDFVNKSEFELTFILFNSKNSELFNYIVKNGFVCKNFALKTKYFIPYYIILFAIKLLFRRVNFVHCHLFEASLIGLISAKIAGIKKRIYTRHHSDFHHTYFPKAVKYDLLINKLATHIIAVSNTIKKILIHMENVQTDKITVIPHGIPFSTFNKSITKQEVDEIKKKYIINDYSPVIGVISRFTEWKGVHYIIPAFKELLLSYPNAKLILANAEGDYEIEIRKLLSDIPQSAYQLILFEPNIIPLYKSFDVFVHTPIDANCEAFGQIYIEALCFEIPMICTLSGIANDLIINERNALVVDYKNTKEIYLALKKLLTNKDLCNKLVHQGKIDVKEYNFEMKFKRTKSIYLS
ncbi:MAG: glycosyltransferase family 4 protein [Bacteroidota bacterium]|nr:glycosyltransferase family 4 protein [Bacteroidota bacterium]